MAHVPDDEQLSAYLDGEADEVAAAHVVACAECSQRLDVLRHVAAAVAAPTTMPPGHVREAAVARALSSHAPGAATGGAKLLRISTRRRRVATPTRRTNVLSAAAVLVVALTAGALAISQIGSGGSDPSTFNAAPDAESATPTGGRSADEDRNKAMAAGGGNAAGSSELATSAPSAYAAGEIGRFTSLDEIVRTARGHLEAPDAAEHQSLEAAYCPLPEGTQLLWQATLHFQNTPAVALVRTTTSSQWVLEIHNPAASDCGLLASQEFSPTTQR